MSTLTVPDILREAFEQVPERIVLDLLERDSQHAISYRQLMAGSCGFAFALQREGIEPGEPVIVILQHGADLIYAFFGAILHGAIPSIMPFLTEKLTPERYWKSLRALLEITRPVAMITDPEFAARIQPLIRKGESVRRILLSDRVEPLAAAKLEGLGGFARSPEDIVLLQHSSGTTGLQKGVALSHRSVITHVRYYAESIQMVEDDTVVSWLPLYHDMGLIAGFLMPILLRARLVLMSPFDWVRAPYKLMKAVSDHHGTLSWLPNFAYNFCAQKVRDHQLEGVDLSSWRAVVNCSEPMRWNSHRVFLERFRKYGLRGSALVTCYAMAENVFAVTQGGIEGPLVVDEVDLEALQEEGVARPAVPGRPSVRMLSAGRPITKTHLRVFDSQLQEVPKRHLGEIGIRSETLLNGYFNRQDLTAEAFHDGWYLTGDLGYLADGELYITGRRKELIIVGGKNIYPQDLEEIASEVTGVHPGRIVAFGIFNEIIGTEDVVIVAETDADDPDKRRWIAEEIRRRVAQESDVVVRFVQIVDPPWIEKTSSGKPARGANREKYLTQFRSGDVVGGG